MSGAIATAVVAARLRTAVGAGANVWDMMADVTDPAVFSRRYVNQKAIHAYEVTREASEPIEGKDVQAIGRRERVVIYGYYSYNNTGASEAAFQAEVDAILAVFDPPRSRQFTDQQSFAQSGIDWSSAPTVEGPRLARLGQYLVHNVRITIPVDFGPIF